jgi:hypothetical protein
MQAQTIYCVRPGGTDGDPGDVFLRAKHEVSWASVEAALQGGVTPDQSEPLLFTVDAPGVENWHYYQVAGTFGVWSETVVNLIRPFSRKCFDFPLRAFVNSMPFYFMRQVGSLDCLDSEHSELVPFPHDPQRIMRVRRYRFFKERVPDPQVFAIAETSTEILATQSIKSMIEAAKLNGFRFVDSEQVRN